MPSIHEKLATSLDKLKQLQADGRRVLQSDELSRTDRERLLAQGFLREVIKGWLISTSPRSTSGDTTPWSASFWEFCARYCENRFGRDWHLSPEQSLLLHAEGTVIPSQVVIYAPKGTNNNIKLLFGTSLYDLKQPAMPRESDLVVKDNLRLLTPAMALVKVPEDFLIRRPLETQIVLARIRDASEVLAPLLEGGHTVVAGRLAGAFRRVGRPEIADEILKSMKAAGHEVRESDPFAKEQTFGSVQTGVAPIVGRLRALWSAMREPILEVFPKPPGKPNPKPYLEFVDDIYQNDAYHSLSIEGYRVAPELIERVRAGDWSPDTHDADRQSRDALAARGYWQAFQEVRIAIEKIIAGTDAAKLVRTVHRGWYRELFQPCVAAGLIKATALAGYRNHPVYLQGSRHVPPRWETVSDAMNTLFDLLEAEREPAVRIVLGHWLLAYVHPYPDGNGRMARFLMNAMLASGGYPWTVIRVEDRTGYMQGLESASTKADIRPFAEFIAQRVKWSMERAEKKEQESQ